MVPVSLRRAGDIDSSNAVGAISADLATNIKDPVQRFRAIKASMEAGKALFEDMSPDEASLFLQLIQLPGLLLIPLGLGSRFPPVQHGDLTCRGRASRCTGTVRDWRVSILRRLSPRASR